jgi:hypothetical protein
VFSSDYGTVFTRARGEITIAVNYGREETSAVASRSQLDHSKIKWFSWVREAFGQQAWPVLQSSWLLLFLGPL